MANEKLPLLPALTAITGQDLFYVVDVSDPTDDPTGSSKRITRDEILQNVTGLTATTISATTYQNLPTDVFVTGGTYTSGDAIFTNNTGGTFTVSGFTVGGGGGQIFYLNLSQSQNGNRLLSTTASTASEQTSGVTINNGVTGTIASFQSQPLNIILLPGGIWSFYLHSYKENTNASFNIFVELYKITSGGTQTLLFATDPTPVTTNSPTPSMQLTDGYFSGTSLNVSDSVVAVVRATNTGNQSHTITLVTEGSQHYSYVVSTIPTQQGLTCDTLSGCSVIQTIQTNISNKFDKSGGTINGDLTVTGNTSLQGVTATTVSATTYYNLPVDPNYYTTAFTYSNNVFTISQSGQSDLTATINLVTGWTVNGNLTVTGNTQSLFSGNTSSDIVRITQTGSGNAFVVEDSASPDSTAFVINNAGDTGIGTTPNSSYKLIVSGASTAIRGESTNQTGVDGAGYVGVKGYSPYTGQTAYGVLGTVDGNGSGVKGWNLNGTGYGVFGQSINGTGVYGYGGIVGIRGDGISDGAPIGVYGYVTDIDGGGTDYIAGKFEAAGGTTRYSVQLQDGTEGVNKVLVSKTSDGKSNWSSVLTGLTSVSATTYYNLPVDPNYYTTAFTYSNNVFTISQSGQSNLTATINSVTGWTVNGNLTVTGNTSLQGVTATTVSATTISATTYYGSGTNLTGVVKGSGTANYLPRWTGTTDLGNSIIRDDGTNVGVNIAPTTGAKFKVLSTTANTYSVHAQGGTSISIWGENTATGGYGVYGSSSSTTGYGLYGSSNGGYGAYASSSSSGFGVLIGVKGAASGFGTSYSVPTGLYGDANGDYGGIGVFGSAIESETGTGVYLGGKFVSTLPSAGGTNYSVQLQDGTEGLNKVLVSKTSDGKANWSSTLTGLTSVSATTISGGTMVITSTPTTDNTNTQVLSRDPSTGIVELVDISSLNVAFNYGLANAIMTGNFLT